MLKEDSEVLLFGEVASHPINAFKKTRLTEVLPGDRLRSFCSCRPHAGVEKTKDEPRCSSAAEAGLTKHIVVNAPAESGGSSSCDLLQLLGGIVLEVHDDPAPLPHAVVQAIGVGCRQDQDEWLYVQGDGRSSDRGQEDLLAIKGKI